MLHPNTPIFRKKKGMYSYIFILTVRRLFLEYPTRYLFISVGQSSITCPFLNKLTGKKHNLNLRLIRNHMGVGLAVSLSRWIGLWGGRVEL